ncbi:MAG: tRNA epoxyqueuosine(34) reductase QueG [Pontibacterium sp.]
MQIPSDSELQALARDIKQWARELGFYKCGITLPDLSSEQERLQDWLDKGYQGEMSYLENHLEKRISPDLLVADTQRIICVAMNYMPKDTQQLDVLSNTDQGYIARYTLGRDYHKIMRKRLTTLGKQIQARMADAGYRAFVDSAPVMERPLAQKAGIGWIGKHGLVLNREAGSWFLLGELFISLPLPIDSPETENHCGSCTACMDVCPTNAFPQPGVLDARRCISYLTIEKKGEIPQEFRDAIGNRIFGCDDCQMICPWNRFSHFTDEQDFQPRHGLDTPELLSLFSWDEETFLSNTEGSAIRRTGFEGWNRNLAIALGNSQGGDEVISALKTRLSSATPLVAEHIRWAINKLEKEPTKHSTKTLKNNAHSHPILAHKGAKRLR